jgi:hypothetical protein
MILFENQDINRGIIHSRYGTGAETWKKTGIMVHMITGTIKAIIRCHTSRTLVMWCKYIQGHIKTKWMKKILGNVRMGHRISLKASSKRCCISIAGSFLNTTNVKTDAGMTGKMKLRVCLYKYSRIKALYCQQTLATTSNCTRGTPSNQLSY